MPEPNVIVINDLDIHNRVLSIGGKWIEYRFNKAKAYQMITFGLDGGVS